MDDDQEAQMNMFLDKFDRICGSLESLASSLAKSVEIQVTALKRAEPMMDSSEKILDKAVEKIEDEKGFFDSTHKPLDSSFKPLDSNAPTFDTSFKPLPGSGIKHPLHPDNDHKYTKSGS